MWRSRYMADFSMWRENLIYQDMLDYLLEELQAEENSGAVDDFPEEEFKEENSVSEKFAEAEVRNETNEFRAERRQFC